MRKLSKADVGTLSDSPEGANTVRIPVSTTLLAEVMDRPFRFEDQPDRRITITEVIVWDNGDVEPVFHEARAVAAVEGLKREARDPAVPKRDHSLADWDDEPGGRDDFIEEEAKP